MSAFYNLASLMLGLASWSLGIAAIAKRLPGKAHCLSFGSMSACAISLMLQLFEVHNRVNIHDVDAVTDTIGAVVLAACTLTAITIVLNLIALIKAGGKK